MEGSANNFFFLIVYSLNEVLAVIFIHKVYKKDTGHESPEPTERKGKQKAKKVPRQHYQISHKSTSNAYKPASAGYRSAAAQKQRGIWIIHSLFKVVC